MDGYKLLGNAIVQQTVEDYVMVNWYIYHNPLTPEVNAKADYEENKRKKAIKDYIENTYAIHKTCAENNFDKKYYGDDKSYTPKEVRDARKALDRKLYEYRIRLETNYPSRLDILRPWESYRNCIVGARATKEHLANEIRGAWLGQLMGEIDPEYLLKKIDEQIQYMAAHNSWNVKPNNVDRDYLGIDICKPRR